MAKLTDNTPMPFGKHQGTAMANVPPDYLLFLYRENKLNAEVREYIHENMEVLESEVKKSGSKFLK
jgi:uncharacterized protein (DUF3820 family)